MKWEIEKSKNGEVTLKNNGYYIYSKYNPMLDAEKFIVSEMNKAKNSFLLIGLGLGYHLEALIENSTNQRIYVCMFDSKEKVLFNKYGKSGILLNDRVNLIKIKDIASYSFEKETQIIMPIQWVKSLGNNHKLFAVLDELKTQQMSYQNSDILDENFQENIKNLDPSINMWKSSSIMKNACLVSAGPSLNENLNLLREIQDNCYIISVGSALKILLLEGIKPDAVIITDPLSNVIQQIQGTNLEIPLFYLSTANHYMTLEHYSNRYIIFQKGYSNAETYAVKIGAPLLETGGSVSTTAFSLLEYMGYQNVFLFGQDLGYGIEYSHAKGSTSGIKITERYNFRKVKANNGGYINTSSNLQVYQRWFENKAKQTPVNIYNTAYNGAKIEGIPYINKRDLLNKIVES